ncbi:Eukaryotic peptide chain release factor subunit 1-3 [Linum perenne]
MLEVEIEKASKNTDTVDREYILKAISSTQETLISIGEVLPPNGLAIYEGNIVSDYGNKRLELVVLEPFRAISSFLYRCDSRFHTEPLKDMLESEDRFGFIVIAENGALFKTLKGNTPEVLHNFSVDLPKNHGRGMWSLYISRLRMEQRHEYVRKTTELARQVFIDSAISEPNIAGLILAGTADLHVALSKSDMFDPRLQARVLNVVQVSYGGEMGFAAVVDLSKEVLSSSRFVKEKKLIGQF